MKQQEHGAEKVEAFVADVTAGIGEGAEKFAKQFADTTRFAKETSAAVAKSAGVTNKAIEKISVESLAFGNRSVANFVAFGKQATETKNLPELVELQSEYVANGWNEAIAKSVAVGEIARGAWENAVGLGLDRLEASARLWNTGRA